MVNENRKLISTDESLPHDGSIVIVRSQDLNRRPTIKYSGAIYRGGAFRNFSGRSIDFVTHWVPAYNDETIFVDGDNYAFYKVVVIMENAFDEYKSELTESNPAPIEEKIMDRFWESLNGPFELPKEFDYLLDENEIK